MKPMIALFVVVLAALPANAGNQEFFIGISGVKEPLRSRVANQVLKLLTSDAKPGDVVHVFSVPDQRPYGFVEIPSGAKSTRKNRPEFKAKLAEVITAFAPPGPNARTEIDIPSVPATIASLRRTEFPARVILVGSPLYSGIPHHLGWSMEYACRPTDSALVESAYSYLSPFVEGVTDLPSDTAVSILTPEPEWGADNTHRSAIHRCWRLFFQERAPEGKGDVGLVRITADPSAAFNLSGKQKLTRVVPNPAEEFGITRTFLFSAQAPDRVTPAVYFIGHSAEKPPLYRVVGESRESLHAVFSSALKWTDKVLVAMRWSADDSIFTYTDCDLRFRLPDKGWEDIAYDSPKQPYGALLNDVRYGVVSRPGERKFGLNYEYAVIHRDALSDLEVWINVYSGIGPITTQVALISSQGVNTGLFTVDSLVGDSARDEKKRERSRAWMNIATSLTHETTVNALLGPHAPPNDAGP